MKVIIIEDEQPAAIKLEKMLQQIEPEINILARLQSVEASVNYLAADINADLIFMDIQLDDGTCFEIFESIKIETPVVFTTAYNQYAIKAFKVNSVDYLLKPIQFLDLQKALTKFSQYHQHSSTFFSPDIFEALLPKQYKKRFFIKVGLKYKSIATSDITCFYITNRNAFLCTQHGKHYDIDYSLEKLEELVDPDQFFRINRNFLINFLSITDIIHYSASRLKIELSSWNGDEIIVSREKTKQFKKWMDK